MSQEQEAHSRVKLSSWEWHKKVNSLAVINKLFFSSFTTVISLVIARSTILSQGSEAFKQIDLGLLLGSLILFFASSLLWFMSNLIFALRIPSLISEYANVNSYLSVIKGTYEEDEDGEGLSWGDLEYKKAMAWNRESHDARKPARFFMFILQVLAVLVYLGAFALFFLGIYQFPLLLAQHL